MIQEIRQYLDRSTLLLLAAGLALVLLLALLSRGQKARRTESIAELAEGSLPDTLRVVTLSGSTTYFTYRGEEMGYQYELLRSFAESVDLPYQIQIAPSLDSIHSLLLKGEADLSITPEAISQSGKRSFLYAGPETETAMVLVQRKEKRGQESLHIDNVTELLGKTVHVLAGSSHARRLRTLEEQLGGAIDIVEVESDTIALEDLIDWVNSDSIAYAIVDTDLAKLSRIYYKHIDISLEVGFTQRLRWLTAIGRERLATSLDEWATSAPKVRKDIYHKYFEMNKPTVTPTDPHPHPLVYKREDGSISAFDQIFRTGAKRISWSWHLLASVACQESNFDHKIIGWSGARGLMGIMPRTGQIYGASKDELLDPTISVRISVACLLDNLKIFKSIPDSANRLKFVLAAYNAGAAHVQDAQRLALKYGHDPKIWDDNVEHYILLKSERKYYTDPVCKYGYLRGRETYNYVREVTHRYEQYQRLCP